MLSAFLKQQTLGHENHITYQVSIYHYYKLHIDIVEFYVHHISDDYYIKSICPSGGHGPIKPGRRSKRTRALTVLTYAPARVSCLTKPPTTYVLKIPRDAEDQRPKSKSAMGRVVELGCGLGNRLYSMSSELKTYPNTTFIWAPDFGLHFNESAKTAPPPSKTCSSPRNPYPHCL